MQQAWELSQKRKDDTPMISAYYLGTAFQFNQDLSKAIKHLEIAEKQALEHENKEYVSRIYNALHEVHESQMIEEALDYLKNMSS